MLVLEINSWTRSFIDLSDVSFIDTYEHYSSFTYFNDEKPIMVRLNIKFLLKLNEKEVIIEIPNAYRNENKEIVYKDIGTELLEYIVSLWQKVKNEKTTGHIKINLSNDKPEYTIEVIK